MTVLERTVCAQNFLSKSLTSRERMFVAAIVLGFSQAHVARAWGVSAAAVSKMSRRIRRKADCYWR